MAVGSFDFSDNGWQRISFSIASGATASGEIDLGGNSAWAIEITTTATTSFTPTLLNIFAASTAGGTKRQVVTSTGGAVAPAISQGVCIGFNSNQAAQLAPFRYVQLQTTAATTAALAGVIHARQI